MTLDQRMAAEREALRLRLLTMADTMTDAQLARFVALGETLRTLLPHDVPVEGHDYIDDLRELIREIVVRARAGMMSRPSAAPPERIDALIDEFEPLIDIVVNGP